MIGTSVRKELKQLICKNTKNAYEKLKIESIFITQYSMAGIFLKIPFLLLA